MGVQDGSVHTHTGRQGVRMDVGPSVRTWHTPRMGLSLAVGVYPYGSPAEPVHELTRFILSGAVIRIDLERPLSCTKKIAASDHAAVLM